MIIFSIYRIKKVWVACILPCLLLSGFVCSAQNFEDKGYWLVANNRYNDLPVDSLWLFHPGNSLPATDSNNTGWQLVNTELLLDSTNKGLEKLGHGWYAKKITVPDQLRGKPVALRMWQFGASEIFMDGKLIKRYGVVGSEMKNEKIYVPRTPVIIDLDNQFHHQLLVHYSNFHAGNPGYANQHPGFRLLISPPWVEPASVLANTSSLPVSIGIIFIFCLYFFFVWIFYPKRLASLITMLLLLDFCVVLTSVYYLLSENEWAPLVRASNTAAITSAWLNFFVLLILYALYYHGKMPRRTWLVIAGMLVCVAGVIFTHFSFLSVIATLLCYVEIVRMFMLGFKNKATGFGLLLTGFLIQQAGFFLIVLDVFHWFPVYTPEVLFIQLIFPQLGIPLTYALHLAWEFRSANRDLRLKLIQVNQLSQKSLEQEQEKQQILAAQNETLEKQVGERTAALTQSLSELKSTQSQLIQAEKMASLGELTAGIAHEIQNPLNFVNNFSDVNKDLLAEMKDEMDKGNLADAKEIADAVIANEDKINHHGKRADAIVKGMLQHSRSSTGHKEPTNINALCDEYLRLSYHGLRAKDKSFNATLKTDFDETVGNINIIPQDIGRVLLNLINNAFYAVAEKKKQHNGDYEPTVSVTTTKKNQQVEIIVGDNGNGIPQNIIDKIFQPFFTTKPTGQGTGLGLSLAYDIVKAHAGELKVETKHGEGSEFIIQLPLLKITGN